MERNGLLERSRESKDRRVVTVRITESGLAILKQVERPVEQELKRQVGRLGAGALAELIGMLELIRQPV
jgi:DNA-binding MarR family transcriptional regulator